MHNNNINICIYLQYCQQQEPYMLDNSDQDEGFVPNKIQIKHKTPKVQAKGSVTPRKQGPKTPFEAHIISGDILLWKQPPQIYQYFQQATFQHSEQEQIKKKKHKKHEIFQHPYKKYTSSSEYKLIYSRKKGQPFSPSDNILAKNQILITSLSSSMEVEPYRKLKPFSSKKSHSKKDDDVELQIDSKFQCGNLYCAYKKIDEHEYDLFIQNDTNTLGYNQWFYFSIQNIKKAVNYRFTIMNFTKKHSVFKYGYKLALFSATSGSWYRGGTNITYDQSPITNGQNAIKYYSLSFQLEFQNNESLVFVAMNIPYSYSKLIKVIGQLKQQGQQKIPNLSVQFSSVRCSLAGNQVPQLIITKNLQAKRAIIITARQHPGQTWSSYMMQGFLRQILTKNNAINSWLLQNFKFIIYPMINVDGVIYGNSRCDVIGMDMNRRWKYPSPNFHPQIFQIKKRIAQFNKNYDINCCLDLHGHSKSYNIFCYSCQIDKYSCRLLPYLIQSINPIFYFPSCTFGISRYKQSTARATIFREIRNENVLTIESSYYGYKQDGKAVHFQPKHLYQMAASILEAIKDFCDKNSTRKNIMEKEIKSNITNLLKYQELTDMDSGSDSEPQIGEIDFKLKVQKIFPKKFASQQIYFRRQKQLNKFSKAKKKESQININRIEQSSSSKSSSDKNMRLASKSKGQRDASLSNSQHGSGTIQTDQVKKKVLVVAPKRKNVYPGPIKLSNTIDSKKQIQYSFKHKSQSQSLQQSSQRKSQSHTRSFLRRNRKKVVISNPKQQNDESQDKKLQINELNGQSRSVEYSNQRKFRQKFQYRGPQNKLKLLQIAQIEDSIYKEDQNELLGVLFRNKRMLQLQRIKRNLQKSSINDQRRSSGVPKKQSIVNYRKFKMNQKVNIQIKRMIDRSARYNGQGQSYNSLYH